MVEVNLLLTDPSTLSDLRGWFDAEVYNKSSEISQQYIKNARSKHNFRRIHRPKYDIAAHETLLDVVLRSPEEVSDRDIWLWIYPHEEPSVSASKRVQEIRGERENMEIDFWELFPNDSVPKPGSIILDFDSEGSKLDFAGAWQILQDKHVVKHNGGKLLLGVKVKKVHNLPVGKLADWKREIKLVLDHYPDRDAFELGVFADMLKAIKAGKMFKI